MTDRWIITRHRYAEHRSLADAERERDRLSALAPGDSFRIRRVKGTLAAGKTTRIIDAAKALLSRKREGPGEDAHIFAEWDDLADALDALDEDTLP